MAYGNGVYATTANISAQGPTDMAPRPASPVMAALQARSNDVSELHQVIDELERRLVDVLRPVPPSGATNGKGEPVPVRCAVADSLDRVGGGINEARQRVIGMLERLEV